MATRLTMYSIIINVLRHRRKIFRIYDIDSLGHLYFQKMFNSILQTFSNQFIKSESHHYCMQRYHSPWTYLWYTVIFISSWFRIKLHENSKVSQMIARALCFGIIHRFHMTSLSWPTYGTAENSWIYLQNNKEIHVDRREDRKYSTRGCKKYAFWWRRLETMYLLRATLFVTDISFSISVEFLVKIVQTCFFQIF